jgi:hypothetical protein
MAKAQFVRRVRIRPSDDFASAANGGNAGANAEFEDGAQGQLWAVATWLRSARLTTYRD